jgi:hypothetical protein
MWTFKAGQKKSVGRSENLIGLRHPHTDDSLSLPQCYDSTYLILDHAGHIKECSLPSNAIPLPTFWASNTSLRTRRSPTSSLGLDSRIPGTNKRNSAPSH